MKGAPARGGSAGLVGLSVVLSGLLVNAYLAVVARGLSPHDYLAFSAYWSLALVAGFGAFLPVEQALARRIHGATDRRSVLAAAVRVAGVVAALEAALVVAASPLLLPAFGHRAALVLVLAVFCFVSAVQFVTRGLLIGLDRVNAYALLLIVDSALRVGFAVLARALSAGSVGYSWTLGVAIVTAHLPVGLRLWSRTRSGAGAGPRPPVWSFARSIGTLLVGSLAAQVLLNGLPVLVAAAADAGERYRAGQFQAAFQLARVPLFVAVPLQTTILPALTRLFGESGSRQLRRTLAAFCALLAAIAAVGVLIAATVGPALVTLVFGARYRIARSDLILMALGVAAYLGLLVTTQVFVAADLHRYVAWSWITALGCAGILFLAVPALIPAAEIAFTGGSAAGLLTGVAALATQVRRRPAPQITASRRPASSS